MKPKIQHLIKIRKNVMKVLWYLFYWRLHYINKNHTHIILLNTYCLSGLCTKQKIIILSIEWNVLLVKSEDNKRIIRYVNHKKDRKYSGQKKKDQRTENTVAKKKGQKDKQWRTKTPHNFFGYSVLDRYSRKHTRCFCIFQVGLYNELWRR